MKKTAKILSKKNINIILLYTLMAASTMPAFMNSFGISFTLGFIVILYKHIAVAIKRETIIIISIISILEIYHFLFFSNYDFWVVRQIIFYFFCSIFVAYYLKLDFLNIYIKIMYNLTLISFIFFIILLVSPSLIKSIANTVPNIFIRRTIIYGEVYEQINPIVYNFDFNFYKIRNNGPFWEPTVFASLLLIAQIFNFLQTKSFFNKNGLIFTAGIITTFSTTVFIAYFILIMSSVILNHKVKFFYKILLCVCIGFSGIYTYSNLSFLQSKINTEIEEMDNTIVKKGGDSRLASAVLDINEVSENSVYFFLGKGSSKYSRIGVGDKNSLRNCGLTALLVEWGILFFMLYIYLIFYSFYQMTQYFNVKTLYAYVFTCIIIIISFSEVFFDLPLFHCLLFFGFIIKRYYSQKSVYSHAKEFYIEDKYLNSRAVNQF